LACDLACFGLEKYSCILKAPWGNGAAVFVCTNLLANQKPQLWPPAMQCVPHHIFLAHFQAKTAILAAFAMCLLAGGFAMLVACFLAN
jgi:hypothetical protein